MNIVRVNYSYPQHLEPKAQLARSPVEKAIRDNFRIQCQVHIALHPNPLPPDFPCQDATCVVVYEGPAARDAGQAHNCTHRIGHTLTEILGVPLRITDVIDYHVKSAAA